MFFLLFYEPPVLSRDVATTAFLLFSLIAPALATVCIFLCLCFFFFSSHLLIKVSPSFFLSAHCTSRYVTCSFFCPWELYAWCQVAHGFSHIISYCLLHCRHESSSFLYSLKIFSFYDDKGFHRNEIGIFFHFFQFFFKILFYESECFSCMYICPTANKYILQRNSLSNENVYP